MGRVMYIMFCITHKDPVGTVHSSLGPQKLGHLDHGHRSSGEP